MLMIAACNVIRSIIDTTYGYLATGTGTTAVTEADTALVTEIVRLTKNTTDTGTDKQVDMEFVMTSSQGNGSTLTEVGLYTAATSGTMGSRDLISPIAKNNTFEISFLVTFIASNA